MRAAVMTLAPRRGAGPVLRRYPEVAARRNPRRLPATVWQPSGLTAPEYPISSVGRDARPTRRRGCLRHPANGPAGPRHLLSLRPPSLLAGFEVALGSHWGRIGVALGCLSVGYQQALGWL